VSTEITFAPQQWQSKMFLTFLTPPEKQAGTLRPSLLRVISELWIIWDDPPVNTP